MASEFTHLHLHTDYSLLDGACDVDKLMTHVEKIGQKSVAMTDHGNIFGAVHFFDAAKQKGIKPILGCELYICQAEDHRAKGDGDKYNHLLVLAENQEGYRNLVRLTSEAALHGFYRKPRVSKQFLAKHTKGLIGFSGCLAGEVSQQLMAGNYEKAKATAGNFGEMFGRGNFFLEIQDHGLEPDRAVTEAMFRMEKDLNIPLIATNDSHYIADEDSRAHEVLLCVQTAGSMNDPKRFKFDTNEFYVKTADEMARLFAHAPHVVSGTMQFPERCNLKLNKVDNPFPEFPVPEGMDLDGFFEQVCREGLRKRLATSVAHLRGRGLLRKTEDEYQARLQREIDCIKQMKFPGYFMIVWDFIRYAREQNIPVGPGRGSAAGSLVAYCMEITDVDPLQNELLFERFLNPERVSMPDIDIDFCMNRRSEVIEYVRRKYGTDQVAQIITFNTMAAKAAIKDVGRALDMPYGEVDRIAKMIPPTIGITIEAVLKDKGPLQQAYDSEPNIKELIDTAMRLEGLVRGAGVHAAGVVIAPQPLTELVPVTRTKDDAIVTSYDMKAIEKMGLLKMDFLGLTTLTVIDDALKLILQTKGEKVDLATIPLDDPKTYEQVFHRALTSGVFQFESGGMRDVLRRYKPTSVEDLTALNALYRPGPIQGGMIDDFIERKWGRRAVEYMFPELEIILRETLGVIVYQEQVMQISSAIGGYSLGGADLLRRAMGKKDPAEMAKQRDVFMAGAATGKFPKDRAGQLFDLMEQFAGYGFNKSHSAAYALLAYHTAWLKVHYPGEFFAANMTVEMGDTDKLKILHGDALKMGITFESPDVNRGDYRFEPTSNTTVRYGLGAVKGTGEQAIAAIVAARLEGGLFTSLYDFCVRVERTKINKRTVEALIKAGAFDNLYLNRASLLASVDRAFEFALAAEANANQGGLFDMSDSHAASTQEPALVEAMPFGIKARLVQEKTAIGFYLSGHLFDEVEHEVRQFAKLKIDDLLDSREPRLLAAIVGDLRVINGNRGKVIIFKLDDKTDTLEASVDEATYNTHRNLLKDDELVIVQGTLQGASERFGRRFKVTQVWDLETARCKFGKYLRVAVNGSAPDISRLVRDFPPRPEMSEQGELMRGLPVRFSVERGADFGLVAADIVLDERARFFPTDAALASWMAQADKGLAHIIYD